jgi:hypothetical protein
LVTVQPGKWECGAPFYLARFTFASNLPGMLGEHVFLFVYREIPAHTLSTAENL